MFVNEIVNEMERVKYGNRSYTKQVLAQVKEQDKQYEVAEAVLEVVAFSMSKAIPLTAVCRKIASRIYRLMDIETEKNDRMTIRLGGDAIHWMASVGLVKSASFNVADNGGEGQHFLMPTNEDFVEYIKSHSVGSLKANNGYTPWEAPVLTVGDYKLDIVKSARRYNMLSKYRYSEMPEVYSALNKLHSTEWVVNEGVLDVLLEALESSPNHQSILPGTVTSEARKMALSEINKSERTALWIEEIKFKQLMDQEYGEKAAEGIAKSEANEYKLRTQFDHLEVISEWSKRMDLERCIKLATEYKGDVLNFIYNCDSRGRVYALQHGLNPTRSRLR